MIPIKILSIGWRGGGGRQMSLKHSTIVYYIVLPHCTVLHFYFSQYFNLMYGLGKCITVLCINTLSCTALYRNTVLYWIALVHCSLLHCAFTVLYCTLLYFTVLYSTIQLHCIVLHYTVTVHFISPYCYIVLDFTIYITFKFIEKFIE